MILFDQIKVIRISFFETLQRNVDRRAGHFAARKHQHNNEQVHSVLGQNERVEGVALIHRVFIVMLELVECYQMPDCEKYLY